MKKYLLILIIVFAILYFVFPRASHAQELESLPLDEPSSFSSFTLEGSGINFSIGSDRVMDSYYISTMAGDSDPHVIFSTSTDYTILNIGVIAQSGYISLLCGEVELIDPNFTNFWSTYFTTVYSGSYFLTNDIHCSDDLTFTSLDGAYIAIQYVPYDTRIVDLNPASRGENNFSLGLSILIVLASITLVAFIFNRIKKPWR